MPITNVYFALYKKSNLVKIGSSSLIPERFNTLPTFDPYRDNAEIVALIPLIDNVVEKNLHKHFEKYRRRGREYFEYSEEIQDFIKDLNIIQQIPTIKSTIADINQYIVAFYNVATLCYPGSIKLSAMRDSGFYKTAKKYDDDRVQLKIIKTSPDENIDWDALTEEYHQIFEPKFKII